MSHDVTIVTSFMSVPQAIGIHRRRDLLRKGLAFAAVAAAGSTGTAFAQAAGSGASYQHRLLTVGGLQMHVVEQGAGPLVILCHGWPELWYSWRHQLPVLADAGFRVVAADLRGFGQTDAPADIAAYSLLHSVGDMVGLVRALGERQAVIVGHDLGATLAWTAALLRPDIFRAVAALSVVYAADGGAAQLQALRNVGRSNFYMFYFQTPGVAEAELERDPASTVRRTFARPANPAMLRFLPAGGGFLDNRPDPGPDHLPAWLTRGDVDYVAGEYRRSGYRGGLNWYRNIDRNGELLAPWAGAAIRQPALFVIGAEDPFLGSPQGKAAVDRLSSTVPGLRRTVLIEDAGHWIQQERPAEVSAVLLDFLRGLPVRE
jgi:pimeloyl-ACP methyl ester carboxylesterase